MKQIKTISLAVNDDKQYQQHMNQQNKSSFEQNHLNNIISALHRKKKKNQQVQEQVSLKKLYETMNSVVSGLDDSINSCKKYNEAKIHRKYEIILNDQSKRIRFLEQKVKQQHRARSPSKKYIQDLLDKLINFKFQNQTLTKQNGELAQQNAELRKKLEIYEENVPTTQKKEEIKKQQQQMQENTSNSMGQITGLMINKEVNSYLRLKNQLRKHQKNPHKTKFQRFLKKIKDKTQSWSMRQFLQGIDKWVVEFTAEPDKVSSPDQDQLVLPQQIKMTTGYNNIGNRILNTKNQIRNRKTYSYRHFDNNKSLFEAVLR